MPPYSIFLLPGFVLTEDIDKTICVTSNVKFWVAYSFDVGATLYLDHATTGPCATSRQETCSS